MNLLVSSQAGDPEQPRTWSGTPARLLAALRADGRLRVTPHSSRLEGSVRRWTRRADALLRLQHDFIPGPAQRRWAARSVDAAARSAGCEAVLHLGTYDAPRSAGGRHYLYVDNSYDLWERHALAARAVPARQRRAFRDLDARALRAMKHVFTVGRHVAENMVAVTGLPADRVTAIGSGPGGVKPYAGPKDFRQARLLTVAKVRPADKGLPLLLEAFAMARRERPDLTLTVVGGAAWPGIAAHEGVRATGWVSDEELQRLYEEAALFVLPAGYEPWGLSYLEALSCRTPIVGRNLHAVPELSGAGQHGFLLEAPEPAALSRLLLDALSDPGRLARMGESGQKHAEHYRWERVAGILASRILQDARA